MFKSIAERRAYFREKYRQYSKRYPEKEKARKRAYYEKHRAEFIERNKKYASENREKINEYSKKYYNKNREKKLEYSRKWGIEHREYLRKYHQAYRKTKKGHEITNNLAKQYKRIHKDRRSAWDKAQKLPLKPCIICGNPVSHRHHPDITKPLEVVYLCPLHHRHADMGLLEIT